MSRSGHWEVALQEASEAGSDAPLAWSLRPLGEAAASALPADSEAVASLVNRFKSLAVTGIADKEQPATAQEAVDPVDRFELRATDGQALRYRLFHDEAEDEYSVSREDIPGRYTLVAYVAEQLRAGTDDLRQPEPQASCRARGHGAGGCPGSAARVGSIALLSASDKVASGRVASALWQRRPCCGPLPWLRTGRCLLV